MTLKTPPILLPFLLEPSITCLIFSHDLLAKRILPAIHKFGIHIPAEISLLSIDNIVEIDRLPISTVDPGTAFCGYCAFHAITQDVPIKRQSKTGHIIAQPRIVPRGSIQNIER